MYSVVFKVRSEWFWWKSVSNVVDVAGETSLLTTCMNHRYHLLILDAENNS